MMREVSSLELVAGGNIIRQGEYFRLGYLPRDVDGQPVNLEGKDITVAILKRSQIVHETVAEFDPGDGLIHLYVDQNIGNGKMWLEFTVTDPNFPSYRKKFPSRQERAVLDIVPGAEDLPVAGIGPLTVEQLRTEQATAQQEFEAGIVPKVESIETQQLQLSSDFQAAAGALTEDSEVILARGDKPTLGARLDDTAVKLAEKERSVIAVNTRTRMNTSNDIDLVNLKFSSDLVVDSVDTKMPLSPYGNKEYVHQDIIYFPQGWNGYRYWMTVNPYANSNEGTENPCIYVSNDSRNWIEPPGVTNPLYPYPGNPVHYSDPCWILDKNGYTLHLIHRLSGAGTDNVYLMMSSDDGRNWSPQVEIYRVAGREIVSPAVVWSGSKYYMYYMDVTTTTYSLKRVESDDLLNWSNETSCPLSGATAQIWHFDIIEYGGGLIFCGNATGNQKIQLFKSRDFQSFTLSSENLVTSADMGGRSLYKPDIILYEDSGKLNLLVHVNLNGIRDNPDVNWEIKRIVVPLGKEKTVVNTSPVIGVKYLNAGATAVEGDVPTTRVDSYHVNDKGLTHLSFRVDIGDLSTVPASRLITLTLPVGLSVYQAYFTFPVDFFGTNANVHNLYGVIDTTLGRMYLKKGRTSPTASTVFRVEDLAGITSIRGSVSYFNNK